MFPSRDFPVLQNGEEDVHRREGEKKARRQKKIFPVEYAIVDHQNPGALREEKQKGGFCQNNQKERERERERDPRDGGGTRSCPEIDGEEFPVSDDVERRHCDGAEKGGRRKADGDRHDQCVERGKGLFRESENFRKRVQAPLLF